MVLQIAERIRADVTTAMKAGERDRVTALRLVLSELQKAAKEGGTDELAVLRRERKRRREAEQAYREAGRDELATAEAGEAEVDRGLPARRSSPTRAGRAGPGGSGGDRERRPRATWAG